MSRRFVPGAASAALILCGCSGSGGPASATLQPADFRSAEPAVATNAAEAQKPHLDVTPIHPSQADEHLIDIASLVGPPASDPGAAPPAEAAGKPVVLDSLVGQINGRPVYASEFLGPPLEGRLRGLAVENKDERRWIMLASQRIREVLNTRLGDELLVSEAQAALNPDQKKGLLHFIDAMRADLVSNAGAGAAVAADEAYREKNAGRGLDAQVEEELRQAMLSNQLRTKVLPLANVSWHDVELEYKRRYAEFNPPATAVFRVIYIADTKAEAISDFTSRLEGGADFAELAARPENDFLRKDAGLWTATFSGDFTQGKFFQDAEYNDPARALKPGQTSPPIHSKNRVAWIHLDRIDTPPSKSLYDVQVSLYNSLREQRIREESMRYLQRLAIQASHSDMESMVTQLVLIARDRYFTPQK